MKKPFSCEWFSGTKILSPFGVLCFRIFSILIIFKASSLEFPLLLVNSDSLRRQSETI